MTNKNLKKVLDNHTLWLSTNGKEGKRANLSGSNLRGSDLSGSNLRGSDLSGSNLRSANLSYANLSYADLRGSDLRGSDLSGSNLRSANLSGADLRGSNLDFSCWPLWCGSFNVKLDKKQKKQRAYHLCRNLDDNDPEERAIKEALKHFANEFHRAEECGKIK